MAISVDELVHRAGISDQIFRYCRAVDRLDTELGYSVFHRDSVVRFPSFTGGGRKWIDLICARHRELIAHTHHVSNILIALDATGDHASSESSVRAILRRQEGTTVRDHEILGRYIDTWSRRDGGWRIESRECVIDLERTFDVLASMSADRSRRDREDPSYAVLPQRD